MNQIEPSIYKTKAYKNLMKEIVKPPKIRITSNFNTSGDKKKAKILQKIINYQFKHNTNGIFTKYLHLLSMFQKKYAESLIYGTKFNWETIEKSMDILVKNKI